ncbi:AmpG family muropeptide MFS transporter [Desulfosarcina ovata]|uniref:MFS transporter n=1 Tax=Desulfosarcina ovata subsp. ovata TaxID=2752305 RepID=A0A5K8ABE6_9BACT|nr:AmpG family muropeptide MFS transporter [Desulfosarcina ovata]BBO89808.1 MFS transporter [Desulfosarcina ovata subsp. ovata]
MPPPSIITSLLNRRMLVALVMGFSCGLPLLLTLSVLQAWMTEAGVDLTTIGLFSLVGLPYTLKFFWSPVFDRFALPVLGRRRGWLLIAQLALMGSLVWLGFSDPLDHPELLAVAALAVAFCSASQDIVVDAYRREDLPDRELGLGSSLYINGYRVGMLLASGGGLILADHIPFSMVYTIMALCLLPGVIATLLTPEPTVNQFPTTLKAAVVDPLVEYFSRTGAWWMLAFILMYKIGDTMAAAMTTPFYLDIGFTKTQIGAVVKLFGFWATVGGTLLGGIVIIRLGIIGSLWIFGILQALSTAGFALLAILGPNLAALSGVIAFENLTAGMGTSAYAAYMASITDKRFTATQYALLTSLMGVPRVLASAPTGYLATRLGWVGFFILCTLIAIPGLLLLLRIGGRHPD